MAMTSRQRVYRALEMNHPDRVPRDLWTLPIAILEHGQARIDQFCSDWPTDFFNANSGIRGRQNNGDMYAAGQYVDEWGCVFENVHAGVIGEVKRSLIDDWSKLDQLREPLEMLDIDVSVINAQCSATERFAMAGCNPRPFERCQFLRGTENLLMDIAEESAEFQHLLKRVHAFNCKELEAWAATNVDGLKWMDDWGTQISLLISPQSWRKWFKPLYAEYVQIAHDAGKKAFMHSDGHIIEIYEDLIEIGVDAINSQLFCMDIEEIGRRFQGRITFWGEIDRQRILPHGTEEEVRQAVRRVADALGSAEGGVIAQFELGAGSKLENAITAYDQWSRYAES